MQRGDLTPSKVAAIRMERLAENLRNEVDDVKTALYDAFNSSDVNDWPEVIKMAQALFYPVQEKMRKRCSQFIRYSTRKKTNEQCVFDPIYKKQ